MFAEDLLMEVNINYNPILFIKPNTTQSEELFLYVCVVQYKTITT